jgi:hypothetical protein
LVNTDARKFSAYSACNSPQSSDLWAITGNTVGTNATFKVTVQSLLGNSQSNVIAADAWILSGNTVIIRRNHTPVTSTDTVTQGTIWWDSSYIYVATANNVIKRATLNSF